MKKYWIFFTSTNKVYEPTQEKLPSNKKKKYQQFPLWLTNKVRKVIKYTTVSVLFFLLLGLAVWQHLPEEPGSNSTNSHVYIGQMPFLTPLIPPRKDAVKCKINQNCLDCRRLNFSRAEDVRYLKDMLQQENAPIVTGMVLDETIFNQSKIEKGWLSSSSITSLTIRGNLTELGNRSLSGFPKLTTLTIAQTFIKHLPRAAFANLTNLTELDIFDNRLIESAEFGFLQEFPKIQILSLKSLNANMDLYSNLTGDKNINSLVTLEFSNSVTYVPKEMTNKFPYVRNLYLVGCGIKEFEAGSLDNSYIDQLHLSRNKLEKLPQNVFEKVIKTTKKVDLESNPLKCDCDMKWLQDLVKQSSGLSSRYNYGDGGDYVDWPSTTPSDLFTSFQNLSCAWPENSLFLDVEMCPDNATSNPIFTTEGFETSGTESEGTETSGTGATTEVTETSGTETTPKDESSVGDGSTTPSKDVEVECRTPKSSMKKKLISTTINFELSYSKQTVLNLGRKKQEFTIKEDDDGKVIVDFGDDCRSRTLLWLTEAPSTSNTKNSVNPRNCTTDIFAKKYDVGVLSPETSYLFCVTEETQLNLLDCQAYKTAPTKSNRPWLTLGAKPTAIIVAVVATVIAFVIGCIILYLLVRKNPVLIKGSKSVIVVKRQKKPQVIVLPKGFKDSESTTPEVSRNSSVDDTFSVVSYISAIQPTPLEIFKYKIERLKAKSQDEMDANAKWQPPPVPPPPYSENERRTISSDVFDYDYM